MCYIIKDKIISLRGGRKKRKTEYDKCTSFSVINFDYYLLFASRDYSETLFTLLFSKIYSRGYIIILFRFMRPWLYLDLTFALSSAGRLQKKTLQNLHGFTEKVRKKQVTQNEYCFTEFLDTQNLNANIVYISCLIDLRNK